MSPGEMYLVSADMTMVTEPGSSSTWTKNLSLGRSAGGQIAEATAYAAHDAAIRGLNIDALSPAVRLRVLEQMEASRRRQVAASHDVIASLAREEPADVGGPVQAGDRRDLDRAIVVGRREHRDGSARREIGEAAHAEALAPGQPGHAERRRHRKGVEA